MTNCKCSSCAGELVFDPTSGGLKCRQCGNIVNFDQENIDCRKKPFDNNSTIEDEIVPDTQYFCNTCGSRHVVSNDKILSNCPSCGDSNLERSIKVEYRPDGFIPFKLDKQKAMDSFVAWLKKRKFAPNNLRKLAKPEFFKPLYVPIYNYDLNCTTEYSGVGVEIEEIRDTVSGPNGMTTTHTRTVEHRYPFHDTRNDFYNDYPDSACKEISSLTMKEINQINASDIYAYRTEYLYGIADCELSVSLQNSCARVRTNVASDIATRIKKSLLYDRIEHFNSNTTFNSIQYNYLYVPVYSTTYKYNNQNYTCYINGATGKTTGNSPKSFWKIFLTIGGIIAIIAGIAILIATSV